MTKIQIALGQIQSVQANVDQNLEKIRKLCYRAQEADIIIFPELACSGYLMWDKVYSLAEPVPGGRMTNELIDLAKETGLHIISGIPEALEPGIIANTAVMVGPSGFIGKYRKFLLANHSIFDEKRYYRPATNIKVINTPFGRLGLIICYDIWEPAVSRILALQGAHTIVCISASPGVRQKYFESFILSRALENTVNMVYVNQTGIQDNFTFWGGSEVRDANGNQLLKLKYDVEDFGIVELDTSCVSSARTFVPTLRDSRSWLYHEIGRTMDNL